jgi:two-component system LytT family response regulator
MKTVRQKSILRPGSVKRVPLWPEIHRGENEAINTSPFTRIAFAVHSGVEFVDPLTVTHLEAQSNYSSIYCMGGRRVVVSKTLKEIARIFPAHFLRIHQSFLVNPQYIQTYVRQENEIRLDSGLKLPVSRSGKIVMQEFLKSRLG